MTDSTRGPEPTRGGISARLARLALASYPLAFQRRYRGEMEALLEQRPPTTSAVLNLLRGSLRARIHPPATIADQVGPADRARLTATGVLSCWVVFAAAGFGYYKTTEDFPFSAAGNQHPLLGGSHMIVQAIALIATGTVLLASAPLIWLAFGYAREHGQVWRLIGRPLLPVAVFVGLTAVFIALAHAYGNNGGEPTGMHIIAVVWMTMGVICGLACVAACRATLLEVPAPRELLRMALDGSTVVTVAMAVITFAVALYTIALAAYSATLSAQPNGPFRFLSVTGSLAIQAAIMALATAAAVMATRRGRPARAGLAH